VPVPVGASRNGRIISPVKSASFICHEMSFAVNFVQQMRSCSAPENACRSGNDRSPTLKVFFAVSRGRRGTQRALNSVSCLLLKWVAAAIGKDRRQHLLQLSADSLFICNTDIPRTQIGTFRTRPPKKGSAWVAVSVHSLMTRSPLLKTVLFLLSESGKRSL
jgi:hypothetical protein